MVKVLAIVVVLGALAALVLWELPRFYERPIGGTVAAQQAAYQRGDYEGQLRALEPLKAVKPDAYLYLRGFALLELGRLQEAEACLRQSLAMEKDRSLRAVAESELGHVLLEQRRYPEAIASFESSVADWPQRGGGHRGIAEALLRQGVQPDEALRQAQQATEIDQGNTSFSAEVRDLNVGSSLATLAWAEAVNAGGAAEVEGLLSKAFALCPESNVPTRARVLYCAGRAYSALGKSEESAQEFEAAASLDPKGNYGRLAKAAKP